MTSNIEVLEKFRRKTLIGFLIAFGVWQGVHLLQTIFGQVGLMNLDVYLSPLIAGGAIYFFINMFQLLRYNKKIKNDSEAGAALENELVALNRLKAFRFTAIVVIVISTAFSLIPIDADIPAKIIARSIVFIGVMSNISAFLYYDRE